MSDAPAPVQLQEKIVERKADVGTREEEPEADAGKAAAATAAKACKAPVAPPVLKSGWSQLLKADQLVHLEAPKAPKEALTGGQSKGKPNAVAKAEAKTIVVENPAAALDAGAAVVKAVTDAAFKAVLKDAASEGGAEKNEGDSSKVAKEPTKPAWKKPAEAVATVALAQNWPSLGDAKQTVKKKDQNMDSPQEKDQDSGPPKPAPFKTKPVKLPVSALQEGFNQSASNNGPRGDRERSGVRTSRNARNDRNPDMSQSAECTSDSRGDRGNNTRSRERDGNRAQNRNNSVGNKAATGGSGNGLGGFSNRALPSTQSAPMPGLMMTPFMPAAPPGANPLFYNNMYPQNVYYPPTVPFSMGIGSNSNVSTAAAGRLQIMESVRKQIDYYFSLDNLCKDIFLRSKMDEKGWIPLAVVANFNRVRMLTPDMMLIVEAMRGSTIVEVAQDSAYLRARDMWEKWVLPTQQRDLSHNPVAPVAVEAHAAGESAKVSVSASADKAAAAVPVVSPSPQQQQVAELQQKVAKAAAKEDEEDDEEEEEDLFEMDEEMGSKPGIVDDAPKKPLHRVMSDKDIEKLIVVTQGGGGGRMDPSVAKIIDDGLALYEAELAEQMRSVGDRKGRPPKASNDKAAAGARFYSASIPRNSINTNRDDQQLYGSSQSRRSRIQGESPPSNSVGWLMGSTPPQGCGILGTSPSSFQSNRSGGGFLGASPRGTPIGSHGSIPKFQHPSHALLEDNGFKQMKYIKYYNRCMDDRTKQGAGHSEEMNTLFRFWCYFLREQYNETMYDDFCRLALEDARNQYHYGMECLFRFFSYGLEKTFKLELYREFEKMTLKDFEMNSLYGLEKFWAFHHYGGIPADMEVELDPKLKQLLETDYKTLDCFKKEKARRVRGEMPNMNKPPRAH